MRILVLDGSLADCLIALLSRDQTTGLELHAERIVAGPGAAERLAGALRDLLSDAGWQVGSLGLIAAVIGPGSFTGLRASLSLAQGIALGCGSALQGVCRGVATRRDLAVPAGQLLWCVGSARRGRVFLECGETVQAHDIDALPHPPQDVLLAGDARHLVEPILRQAGVRATCSPVERPSAISIAAVACDQLDGTLAGHPALPLYLDPPRVTLPAAGLRPAPG